MWIPDDFSSGGSNRFFPQIKYFISNYAPPGLDDQRTAQVFIDCETAESINTLKNELRSIANGNYHKQTMDEIIGANKLSKHGSYDNWAKLMLLWMANYKG